MVLVVYFFLNHVKFVMVNIMCNVYQISLKLMYRVTTVFPYFNLFVIVGCERATNTFLPS